MDLELDQFKDVNLVINKVNDVFIPRQFVSQGDYKGRTLTVQITNNGSIGEVPGLALNLNWHNEASGLTDLTAFTILDKTNSIFRIEYPENMMTPGKVYASIQIIQDGKVTNLKQFELIVQKLAGQPVGIAQKAEFSALVAVLADSNKFRTDIDSLSASKADKNYINDYLSKVTVVPETFADLAAIKSKYPSGKNGMMVAADNGHKYIWANNVWTDAGVYQAVGLAKGGVKYDNLDGQAKIGQSVFFDIRKSALNRGYYQYLPFYYEIGQISTSTGNDFDNTTMLRTGFVQGDGKMWTFWNSNTDLYDYQLLSYQLDGTFKQLEWGWENRNGTAFTSNASLKYRLTLKTRNGSDASVLDGIKSVNMSSDNDLAPYNPMTIGTDNNTYNYDNYEYSENRLHIDGLEKNKYIERNGVITDYSGWALSNYLPVEKNEIYVWTYDIPATGNLVPNVYCGLFDINKKYIGSGNQETDTLKNKSLIKTDSNTAYVRISQDLKYFTNNAMVIRKALYDQGIKELIPFKQYLKNSPVKEIEEKTNSFATNYQPNYDNVVRSIQRIGDGMEHPIHSVEAFKDAYRKGFRILLCDLIFTSDNVPVCNHDSYLNQYYKNVYDSNGALVSTNNPIYFSQNTYASLSKYNYGGMGYPLLKFTDMLKLVKQLGVELYVEVKGMTEQQAQIACDLVKQFGLSDKTSWAGTSSDQMNWVTANVDTARVALMPSTVTDDIIAKLNSLKTGKNKVFIFGWDTMILTDELVNKLMQNDIAFEQGTPNTEQDIKNYFARGNQYYYCTGIETNAVIAGKVLLESSLSL